MQQIFAALFGGRCFICRGEAGDVLCAACHAELPRLGANRCPCCALASPGGVRCGRCLRHAPRFDATTAALAYEFPADALVHALKFRAALALAPLLAGLMLDRIEDPSVDCVLPVPLSAQRLRQRGYNQAAELARCVASAAGARLELALCVRKRDTEAQSELPWAERSRNVRGAFGCTRPLPGARIAVVDDVMTTGATLDEIAATLKDAGAVRVVNWVLARTSPPDV
jgi:ComF family protein